MTSQFPKLTSDFWRSASQMSKVVFLTFSHHQSHLCPWNFHDFYQYPSGMVFHWVRLDLDAVVWRYSTGHLLCNASLLLDYFLWRAHDGKSPPGKGQWTRQNKLVVTRVSSGVRPSVQVPPSPLTSCMAIVNWLKSLWISGSLSITWNL